MIITVNCLKCLQQKIDAITDCLVMIDTFTRDNCANSMLYLFTNNTQ